MHEIKNASPNAVELIPERTLEAKEVAEVEVEDEGGGDEEEDVDDDADAEVALLASESSPWCSLSTFRNIDDGLLLLLMLLLLLPKSGEAEWRLERGGGEGRC